MIRSGLWWSIGMIIASIGVSVYGTYQIPSDMVLPVHWSLDGQADQYMQRDTVMVSIPAVMVLMTALFAAIPFIDPRTNNVRRSAGLYYASWFHACLGTDCVHCVGHAVHTAYCMGSRMWWIDGTCCDVPWCL